LCDLDPRLTWDPVAEVSNRFSALVRLSGLQTEGYEPVRSVQLDLMDLWSLTDLSIYLEQRGTTRAELGTDYSQRILNPWDFRGIDRPVERESECDIWGISTAGLRPKGS